MLKFSSHLEMNYDSSVAFRDRWLTAHQVGFQGCEFVWRNHELDDVMELKSNYPLTVSCMGGTTGGKIGGDRPVLTHPDDRERLAKDVEKAVSYAQKVSCSRLIMVTGNLNREWSLERHRQEAITSLKYVAPIVEQAGIAIVIEPLNSIKDHKGVYCDSTAEAFQIVDQVGSDQIKILYDVYHMQIMEGNLIETIRNNQNRIGYYHLAKVPGRVEPVGGEVNFSAVLEAIADSEYDGFIGLEYSPSENYLSSFEKIKMNYPSFF